MANAPDLITFVSSAKTAAGLMRVVREKHADVRFAVWAWAANQLLLEMAGQSAEGMIAEQYHDLFDQSAAYVRFDESYRNRFKRQPDYAAVIAYDATNLLLDGLADTRATARSTGLKEALLQKQDFTGLQTAIKLDRYGDASRSGFTAVVRNGQYSPLR
jgi:branched-chain amino acid transport system substrate-binding protein